MTLCQLIGHARQIMLSIVGQTEHSPKQCSPTLSSKLFIGQLISASFVPVEEVVVAFHILSQNTTDQRLEQIVSNTYVLGTLNPQG